MSGRRRPAAAMKRHKRLRHLPPRLQRLNGTRPQAARPSLSQTGMRKCHRPRKPHGLLLLRARLNRQPRQAEQAIASSLPPCAAMAKRERHGNAFRPGIKIFLALSSQKSSGQIWADWEPFTVSSLDHFPTRPVRSDYVTISSVAALIASFWLRNSLNFVLTRPLSNRSQG